MSSAIEYLHGMTLQTWLGLLSAAGMVLSLVRWAFGAGRKTPIKDGERNPKADGEIRSRAKAKTVHKQKEFLSGWAVPSPPPPRPKSTGTMLDLHELAPPGYFKDENLHVTATEAAMARKAFTASLGLPEVLDPGQVVRLDPGESIEFEEVKIGSEWLNAVQQEIAEVIKQRELGPSMAEVTLSGLMSTPLHISGYLTEDPTVPGGCSLKGLTTSARCPYCNDPEGRRHDDACPVRRENVETQTFPGDRLAGGACAGDSWMEK